MKLRVGVCGGTFDHFHRGHREFLGFALSNSGKLVIGITSQKYIAGYKNNHEIESFEKRLKSLTVFLGSEKKKKWEIVLIDDLFGPTLDKNREIDAIFVSDHTLNGARLINREREKLGLPQLAIDRVPLYLAEDEKPISSSRIRDGEINREGRLYIKKEWVLKDHKATEEVRKILKKPFGSIIKDFDNWILAHPLNLEAVVSVGDVATKSLYARSLTPTISVIDLRVARKDLKGGLKYHAFTGSEEFVFVKNPAGHITADLVKTIQRIGKQRTYKKSHIVLQVEGEEDLTVLPILLSMPLGFIVFYGQPGEGVVKIEVSEKQKENAYTLMNRFTTL